MIVLGINSSPRRTGSNSEALLVHALDVLIGLGADVNMVNLNKGLLSSLKSFPAVEEADAIIMSNPVYFGDMPAVASEFFSKCGNAIRGKVFAALSVGAKRNGGQETTNLYALYSAFAKGAIICGNGPPLCQYGGCGVAGAPDTMYQDWFGESTATGVAHRVFETVKIVKSPLYMNGLTTYEFSTKVMYRMGSKVKPCKGCAHCPPFIKNKQGEKVILDENLCTQKDKGGKELRENLQGKDAIIFKDINWLNFSNFLQGWHRTRCLRRADFRLSNIPFYIHPDTEPMMALRLMTLPFRHNSFTVPWDKQDVMRRAKYYREHNDQDYEYKAVGHD